jgi:Nucleotidyltransferase domain
VVAAIREALERSKVVSSVVLGGSRARGAATELSDWDLYAEGESERMMEEIPALVGSFGPLAAFWDPLSEQAGYMVVMNGPIKVDVFPIGASRKIQPPWLLGTDTLAPIDAHFWDWTLWLGGKALRGERQLVADELVKMHGYLLASLGVASVPASLDEAVALYRPARAQAVDALGVAVSPELGRQVSEALHRHGLLALEATP